MTAKFLAPRTRSDILDRAEKEKAMRANAKRPDCFGGSRAAKDDQIGDPIAAKSTRDETVRQAADWYAANRDSCPHPVVPALKQRFGLSTVEAVRAITIAGGRGRGE